MRDFIEKYFRDFASSVDSVSVTGSKGAKLKMVEGIEGACELIKGVGRSGKKLIFIGNGGSAGIASHMAVDFWKNGGIKAIAFNDSSLLTCISNDYGYEHVFEKPIEMFADAGDVLIAISSSGKSANIIKGVAAAKKKGAKVITLSGFSKDNPLRSMGDHNFYVQADDYGPVEVIHQFLVHLMLDAIMKG